MLPTLKEIIKSSWGDDPMAARETEIKQKDIERDQGAAEAVDKVKTDKALSKQNAIDVINHYTNEFETVLRLQNHYGGIISVAADAAKKFAEVDLEVALALRDTRKYHPEVAQEIATAIKGFKTETREAKNEFITKVSLASFNVVENLKKILPKIQ